MPGFRFAYGRPPAVASNAMVATSQPLATRAGLRALEGGGNAADAALAAAAVLCVTEPMSTGIGGDAFAIVCSAAGCEGLDAAGPAPANASPLEPVEEGKKVKNNVRKLRTERMMSKAELARRAGLSTLTIDRVERGMKARMDTKRKILEALGLKPTDRVMVFGDAEED